MNSQRLCPVYRKWLQLHPANARAHRLSLQIQAQEAHQQGKSAFARDKCYQAFETAKVVLTALQPVSKSNITTAYNDIISFGALGMYLSSLLQRAYKKHEAHEVLQECQQLLIAVMPLHAANPSVCRLISAVQHCVDRKGLPPNTLPIPNVACH